MCATYVFTLKGTRPAWESRPRAAACATAGGTPALPGVRVPARGGEPVLRDRLRAAALSTRYPQNPLQIAPFLQTLSTNTCAIIEAIGTRCVLMAHCQTEIRLSRAVFNILFCTTVSCAYCTRWYLRTHSTQCVKRFSGHDTAYSWYHAPVAHA